MIVNGTPCKTQLFLGCETPIKELTMDNGQLTIVDAGYARVEFFDLGAIHEKK